MKVRIQLIDNSGSKLEALITIMDADLNNYLVSLYETNKFPVIFLAYGHGSAKSKIYEMLGYGGSKKIVSISINTGRMSNFIINQLHKRIDLSMPGTGIAFTIGLSGISRILSGVCKKADENFKMGSETMTAASKEPYSLIVAIVNSGHFESVMDAAKSAGASGGTLVHARSIGSKEAIKYLGITLQPEKDLVMILAQREKKLAIMESITAKTGLNTEAMACCFSLPVSRITGVGSIIDNFDEI